MNSTKTSFATRLAALRGQRGLTQQQLADAADCSREHVSRLETGSSGQRIQLATMQRLAAALGVKLEQLA